LRNRGRQWPSIAARREHAREVRDVSVPDERRSESLRRVQDDDRQPEPPAVHTPDVRPADVAAAVTADVLVLDEPHEPVAPRHRAEQVAGDDEERVDIQAYFWNLVLRHPVVDVDQSRLSKNASMYDARSVW
jgi:hypothetical protein